MNVDPQNEALGVMSYRVRKGISDLLHSFGLGNDEVYHEIHDVLEEEILELLKKYGIKVI